MRAVEFVTKWRRTTRTERFAAQEHLLDLCRVLEVPTPADLDRAVWDAHERPDEEVPAQVPEDVIVSLLALTIERVAANP